MHDMGRNLGRFMLAVCWSHGLLHPMLDAQMVASYTAALNFKSFPCNSSSVASSMICNA